MVVLLTVNWNQYLLLIYLFIYCKNIWTWSLLKYFPCVDCVNYGLIPHQRMFCLWINFIQLIHRQSQLPSTVTARCSGTHLMLLQCSNFSVPQFRHQYFDEYRHMKCPASALVSLRIHEECLQNGLGRGCLHIEIAVVSKTFTDVTSFLIIV